MREGLYVTDMPLHNHTMSVEEAELLRDLTETDLECLGEIPLNREQRVAMLSRLVEYYSIHLEAIRSVRSIEILQEVFWKVGEKGQFLRYASVVELLTYDQVCCALNASQALKFLLFDQLFSLGIVVQKLKVEN